MGVNSLHKTVSLSRQRRDCDLNPGPSAPESSTLTTRLVGYRYDTIGDSIATCAQRLTQVSLIYRTEPKLKSGKKTKK